MANLKEHAWIGAGVGVLTYAIMRDIYERPFDLGEMLMCAALSTVAATVPDVIEPALHPHHRSFAHSFVTAAGLLRIAVGFCDPNNSDWDPWQKTLWASATAGYLSHLAADGCTPRGLPLLGS
jgi:inner membrane protein